MGSVSREIFTDEPHAYDVYKDDYRTSVGTKPPTRPDHKWRWDSKDITINHTKTTFSVEYIVQHAHSSMKASTCHILSVVEPLSLHHLRNKYPESVSKLVTEVTCELDCLLIIGLPRRYPLPAAFEDAFEALRWVSDHAPGGPDSEEWIRDHVDFEKVFMAGDSAGATIAHQLALRVGPNLGQAEVDSCSQLKFKISGIILINPYFWGKDPIGSESTNSFLKSMVDKWWEFVCPSGSDLGLDHPLINPLVDGAPDLSGLGCGRVLVTVSEMDILRDRGWGY
ncbi:probable carboxylesterase 2 [Tanacetum coccineum]